MVQRSPSPRPNQTSPQEQALTTPELLLPQILRDLFREFSDQQSNQTSRNEMLQIHRDIVELKTKLEAACKQIEAQNAIADDLKSHRTSVKTIAAIAGAVITGGIALCALLVGPEISILRDHAHKLQAEKSQQDAKLPAANSSSKSD